MTRTVPVHVLAATFFSTHHASAADAVAGVERPVTAPAYALLTGRSRRFTSLATQMHIEVCGALPLDAAARQATSTVFATCHGEIQCAQTLIADFHATAMVSSARFALSVHNTPSGLYSVAIGSTAPSTTITGSSAIAAGWLEAALTALDEGRPVLLSIADEPVPAVFQGPTRTCGVAAAFLLGPGGSLSPSNAELVITPGAAPDAEEPDPLPVLAQAVLAATRGPTDGAPTTARTSTAVPLGPIQPGATLALRFS